MRPRGGLGPGPVWAQRVRQLEQRARTQEERIIALETENAALHLKLAAYQGWAGRSVNEILQLYSAHGQQQKLQRSSVVTHLHEAIKRLKQDMKSLHSFALELSKDFQCQYKACLYQVLTAVQGIQLQNEAMQMFQMKAFDLEQSLQDVTERYEREKQKRRALHNSLVELRGNIRVHCRIRPSLPFDHAAGHSVSQDRSSTAVVDVEYIHRAVQRLGYSDVIATVSNHRHRNSLENVAYAIDDETVLVKCSRPGHAPINKTFQFESSGRKFQLSTCDAFIILLVNQLAK